MRTCVSPTAKVAVVAAFTFIAILPGSAARATLVTSTLAFPSDSTVVTFNDYQTRIFGNGPLQVGAQVGENILFTSTTNNSAIGPTPIYGFGLNGNWDTSKSAFVGSNAETATLRFTFNSGAVNSVGAFMNYSTGLPAPDTYLSVFDSSNNLLETYNLNDLAPINTQTDPLALNAGAFRGVFRPNADIAAVEFSNNYVAVDDLRFARRGAITAAAPEPTSLAFALPALGIVGAALRNRKAAL